MARQVLDHGVIIPAEYSDDWYEDMSTNLNKLDEVIGSDADKLSEADVSEVALSGDYDDLTNKPDLKPVATSGDYDDLTNKPGYGILRMTSETLSDSGSGAISNLNSDSKLAAGDYVLDAALKVFPIAAVSALNYTVGTSLFQITNASALAAVATSGSYDDLNNLPTYGITRFVNAAITDNSNVAFANISSVDKIKAGDFLLDNAGKMYLIASVDTVNETAAVTTPLTVLALDANVMHLSGNESASGDKNFQGLLTTIPSRSLWPSVSNTSDDIKLLGRSVVHLEQLSSGRLTDLSGGAWNVVELGIGVFFFRNNTGTDIRYKHLDTGMVSRIPVVSGANRFINDVTPDQDNTYDLGSSSLRWRSINDIMPSMLNMPDISQGIDISGYLTNLNKSLNTYTPLVNGWIEIELGRSALPKISMRCRQTDGLIHSTETSEFTSWGISFPVIGGKGVSIYLYADSLNKAKFYPCQGNV